ncbi:MAG TPA: anthranilate synthase component I [Rhodothermales bacterium]|nr:anthranilate synthase component I [Rhodothermales bacterium]
MTFTAFKELILQHPLPVGQELVIPIFKRLNADLVTPVSAFLALRETGKATFLLESVEGGEHLARYSFIGKNPYCTVTAHGREVHRTSTRDNEDRVFHQANIYSVLQEMLDRYVEIKAPELPRLTAGAVGFMGYDTVRLLENLPDTPPDDLGLPDAVWCFYDSLVAFDHVRHEMVLISNAFIHADSSYEAAYYTAYEKLEQLEEDLSHVRFAAPPPIRLMKEEFTSNQTPDAYKEAVEKSKQYIYEGDIFQVVVSQRFETQFEGDAFNLYRALRQVNPSPYLFFLDFIDFMLIGSSPEDVVSIEDGQAKVLPIAGTRPRGATATEDRNLETELLADPKERAEHLMLVDLGRNDLSRVCEYGTVQVEEYAYVARYSHVMHLVSLVTGKLKPGKGALDVLAACFPAGTVSGAPKVRAMQIIDEFEPTKRGVYSGAIGYLDFSNNMDSCIALRTMVVKGNRIYIQAGAGLVADSTPQTEFEETVNKSMALRKAIWRAAGRE